MKDIEICGGSVIGRNHRQVQKNNQDALGWIVKNDFIAAIVADGCGSGRFSEVGAQIGVRMILESIERLIMEGYHDKSRLLAKVRLDVLAQIRNLANQMGKSLSRIVADYFLFTLTGIIITETEVNLFSLGDGLVLLNGVETKIGPFPGNEPPYLGYALTGTNGENSQDNFDFKIIQNVAYKDFQTAIIGTDGLFDLSSAASKNIPGKNEPVGNLNQYCEEDRYFKNVDNVRRRLNLIGRDFVSYERGLDNRIKEIHNSNGLLPDDTTLVAIRKKGVLT